MLPLQEASQSRNKGDKMLHRMLRNSLGALCGLVLGLCCAMQSQAQTAPTGLANGTAHSTTFTWTASAPVSGVTVAGYNLYCSATSSHEAGTTAINGSTLIPGTTYTDTSVTAGTTQYCVVAAATAGSAQQSAFSNEVNFTTPPNPAVPTGLSIATVAINTIGKDEVIYATWEDKPGTVTGYVIWNGTKVLESGVVTDTAKTGMYAVIWAGAAQANVYVQVFDMETADQPAS